MSTHSPSWSLTPLRHGSAHLQICRFAWYFVTRYYSLLLFLGVGGGGMVCLLFLCLVLEVVYYHHWENEFGVNLAFDFHTCEFIYPFSLKVFHWKSGMNESKSYVLMPFSTVGSFPLFWPLQKVVSSVFVTTLRIHHWSVPMGGLSLATPEEEN